MQALRQCGFEIEEEYEDGEYSNIPNITEEEVEAVADDEESSSPVDPTQFLLDTNVLVNELQCVGLNRHYRSSWVLTVLKALCYPKLVPSESE